MQDHDLAIRISSNAAGRPRVVMLQLGRAKSVLIALINSSVFHRISKGILIACLNARRNPSKEAAVCARAVPAPMRLWG